MLTPGRRSFVVTVRHGHPAAEVEDLLGRRRARVKRLTEVGAQINEWLGRSDDEQQRPAGSREENS